MESTSEKRVMGRLAARELTAEELRKVSGGHVEGLCYPDGNSTSCTTLLDDGYSDILSD
jgi:hypothetical protein